MKHYAGIGSRETPVETQEWMSRLAAVLCGEGWTLRSGHAPGADQAFERGAGGQAEIFLPWSHFESQVPVEALVDGFHTEPTEAAYEMAERFHPAWGSLERSARALHARNSHQILGRDLETPSRFVLCWTSDAKGGGGTGQAIRVARAHEIPVFDLADADTAARVARKLRSEVAA